VLGKRLALVAAVAVAAFIGLELARGRALGETLLDAVALAVAAIPEGLPAVVTVTLAVGTFQMAKRGAVVKRLASVETLGATTVICSDKTGTLTQNRMQARILLSRTGRHTIDAEGDGVSGHIDPPPDDDMLDAVRIGLLCNDASIRDDELIGDPTEGALVALADMAGLDPVAERATNPRLGELPFDSAIKLMATVHVDGADTLAVHVKGALDVLVGLSDLDADERARLLELSEHSAAAGLRVLGLATRRVLNSEATDLSAEGVQRLLEHLEIVGIVSLGDPPRAEAKEAIRRCRDAGIDVVMITGDHATTAGAIADQIGITGPVITGAQLDQIDDDELRDRLGGGGVVARVAPEHKVRIVEALQATGDIVAMNGDGVNDAPALKRADIGVAMGITGTEVSKEAADMVLSDDNFATIVSAVEQGRTIYGNIVTFVRFQLATNIGAITAMLAAPLVGLPVPFTAIQLLWVNIIMDGPPAMALGVDPPRPDTMRQPPREPDESILNGSRLLTLLLTGAVMAAGTLGLLAALRGERGNATALTIAFTTFVLFQLFNALSTRADRHSVFSRATLRNRHLWLALGGVLVLQVLAVELGPLRGLFGTVDIGWRDWLLCALVASSVMWVNELRRIVTRAIGRDVQ
jgi:P-type Ca2+ transporter type 2C